MRISDGQGGQNVTTSFAWERAKASYASLGSVPEFFGTMVGIHAAIFCAFYLLAIFSYDYLAWARGTFIRFAIPVLPFVFFAFCDRD